MLFHSLLICFQGLTVVHSLQGHHLHHYSRHLDARHNKPNDILTIGTQSVSAPSTASSNTGYVTTALETNGVKSVIPFATDVPSASATIKLAGFKHIPLVVAPTPALQANHIFDAPISAAKPIAIPLSRPDHPVPRKGIINQKAPIGTNKFYAGFFLGNQANPVWTHPYSLQWSRGSGNAKSWGLAVSHIEANQRIYGPVAAANPVQYFVNPIGVQSLIFSARELGPSTVLTTDTLTAFSANVNLQPYSGSKPAITLPVVQGMGFVTAVYHRATPFIESSVFFKTITALKSPKAGVSKYRILLADDRTWLLYAKSNDGSGLSLRISSSTRLTASGPFAGIIQIAKNPGNDPNHERAYDTCAGSYATTSLLDGFSGGSSGSYSLTWKKAGNSSPLMMFALPHHLESLDAKSATGKTGIQFQTTVKGIATGVIGDSWTLVEPDLPIGVGFAPWDTVSGPTKAIPNTAKAAINAAGLRELSQNMDAQINLDSMYFSGKALSKFATAIYAVHDLTGNVSLANAGLAKLKLAFERFTTNKQKFPLTYESAWGGIVSTAAFVTGDANADFGNSYYNDHHFHWSYFIHAASIIGYLDRAWYESHKDWVNTLVRDCANPSPSDPFFPVSRSFDWYHGHSWAKGLFESADGKDEESSSEDVHLAYAVKMWGRTSNDAAMEARGNLMMAVLRRSLRNYFLLEGSNANQPARFIRNKVTGILFENKVDYTTYFGARPEYIHGIHMLPILPSSAYARSRSFVAEEWKALFDHGRVDQAEGGWRGVLYGNLALVDPQAAWRWFSGRGFDAKYLDGGASLTWYLAFAAGLGGAAA